MDRSFPRDWMWSEAFALLAQAERLHREVFRPVGSATRAPAWEPPVDILETAGELLIVVALPGVDPDQIEAAIVDGDLVIARNARAAARAADRRHPPPGAAPGPLRAPRAASRRHLPRSRAGRQPTAACSIRLDKVETVRG